MWPAETGGVLHQAQWAGSGCRYCWLETSVYETSQRLNLRRSYAHTARRRGITGKRGTRWAIRARRIRKRGRNRTPKNNIRKTKRRRTSNRKETPDIKHSAVVFREYTIKAVLSPFRNQAIMDASSGLTFFKYAELDCKNPFCEVCRNVLLIW